MVLAWATDVVCGVEQGTVSGPCTRTRQSFLPSSSPCGGSDTDDVLDSLSSVPQFSEELFVGQAGRVVMRPSVHSDLQWAETTDEGLPHGLANLDAGGDDLSNRHAQQRSHLVTVGECSLGLIRPVDDV